MLEFAAVQAGVQFLSAVSGVLIVRSLSKSEYAIFAIANSMQSACNILADLGISIGVRSIGGRVWNDRVRLGSLLNTALRLRRHFAFVSLGVCVPTAVWMLWKNGASAWAIAALCGIIIAATIPLLASSIYGVVAQFHGEYRRIQKLDFGNAILRCALIGGLALTRLSAVTAALVGVAANWIQLKFLRPWAAMHADPSAPPNAEDRSELIRLSWKSMPNAVFFCFQGQVTLLILTWIGNPTAVADVTALGRLSALLTVFSAAFCMVLAPRFARCQDATRLPRLYLLLVGSTVGVLASLTFLAWLFPKPLLWLLGAKYATLEAECAWVVAAGCIGQLSGVLWSLNSSKAWIRFQSPLFIPAILVCQIVAALFLDLRNFHDVLIFNLVSAAAPIPVYIADSLFGFRRMLAQKS